MDGLEFVTAPPPVPIDPGRADIACFVGFVARRAVRARKTGESDDVFLRRLPEPLRDWLREHGWVPGRDGRTAADLVALDDIPVPIGTWDTFDALFAWNERAIDGSSGAPRCDTALGAAVRSFFEEGGRLCYVVRLGDPWAVLAPDAERRARAAAYLPALPPASPAARRTWRGVAHLFGLPGVSFLCLPDLPDVFGVVPPRRDPISAPEDPEVFIECAARFSPPAERFLRGVPAPRCDEEGFRAWAGFVRGIAGLLVRHGLREVQLVAAVPLPADHETLRAQPGAAARIHRAIHVQWEQVATIDTAFAQLVYPWLRTRNSGMLPGNVMAPDGLFVGLLAASALLHGSWRSLVHQPIPRVTAVEPVLDRATLARPLTLPDAARTDRTARTVREHVSVIGPTAGGMRVLSDVTTDDDEIYRPASVNRLVVAIVRAARIAGETSVFANNGEELWLQLREGLDNLLAGFWSEGALLGATAREASEVRCDRSTMTQSDIDAGRLIVRVTFTAAHPIVQITVVLAMDEGGRVTLATTAAQPLLTQNQPAA